MPRYTGTVRASGYDPQLLPHLKNPAASAGEAIGGMFLDLGKLSMDANERAYERDKQKRAEAMEGAKFDLAKEGQAFNQNNATARLNLDTLAHDLNQERFAHQRKIELAKLDLDKLANALQDKQLGINQRQAEANEWVAEKLADGIYNVNKRTGEKRYLGASPRSASAADEKLEATHTIVDPAIAERYPALVKHIGEKIYMPTDVYSKIYQNDQKEKEVETLKARFNQWYDTDIIDYLKKAGYSEENAAEYARKFRETGELPPLFEARINLE